MEQDRIRERIETLVKAIRAKDVDALWAHYAPDVVTFDVQPPLQVQGGDYRQNFEMWFASLDGEIDYETKDLRISTSGDVAFCHSLNHIRSTRKNGEKADYWVRVSSGLRMIDGEWLITHEHVSLPVSMQTMKAWRPE
jgi:uncharacterized protein (TIGR02246 family)